MSEKAWVGAWCVGAGLVLGALGDVLFRSDALGINVLLWTAALVALVVAPSVVRGVSPSGRWMFAAAILFAAFVAWRDSEFLAFLNVCGVLACLSLVAWGSAAGMRLRGVSGYALSAIYAGVFAAAGPVPVAVSDVRWDEVSGSGWRKPVFSVIVGICIAAPLLFVFGVLLASADAVFMDVVASVFDFDVEVVVEHAFLIGFFSWISAGYIRSALAKRTAPDPSIRRPEGLSLGSVEVGVALGLVNALFLVFVVIQARYLFGGAQRVAAGLTYAEYARSGFFELVAVVALVVPLLLIAGWLYSENAKRVVFTALAVTTVALVLVIMVSALWRMNLYYEEFGLTELRFYSTAFMVWLGVILAFLTVEILTKNRRRFASWTLVSGLAAIIVLNAANPDALIARANIERLEAGERFDPYYLTALSADAAPILAGSMAEIGAREIPDGYTLEETLVEGWKTGSDDWRAWNSSRARAAEIAADLTSE